MSLAHFSDTNQKLDSWLAGGTIPPVSLNGRNVQRTLVALTSTPLAAYGGADTFTGPTVSLTTSPGLLATSLQVYADTVVRAELYTKQGARSRRILMVCLAPNTLQTVPAIQPWGSSYYWVIKNMSAAAQTILEVNETRYLYGYPMPSNLTACLIRQLAIRDTTTHTASTDPSYIFDLFRLVAGGSKLPIYVENTHDQAVDITIAMTVDGQFSTTLGVKNVAAGNRIVITNMDFPGLDVPSEKISLYAKCSTAPTTGTVSAYADTLVGGAA